MRPLSVGVEVHPDQEQSTVKEERSGQSFVCHQLASVTAIVQQAQKPVTDTDSV